MAWDVEATDEFKQWFAGLAEAEQISIGRKVDLLEMLGPVLGRPDVDSIKGFALSEYEGIARSARWQAISCAFRLRSAPNGNPADWRAHGCERLVRESHRSCGWHL